MKNMVSILAATALVGFATSAYAADKAAYEKDGNYESSRDSEYTTKDGTTHATESTTDVDVDSDGRIDKTVRTESTVDPRGLMNKRDTNAETEIEEKERGGYKQTTTREHTDADGTNVTYKTVTDVDVDRNGKVTSTATTEKTVNPKGLMNETTTKSKTKAVNGTIPEKKTR